MKTLIIHPTDKSTNFLKPIYENITDKTVITGGMDREEVNMAIDEHDVIMMMGHGSPSGLFAVGQFKGAPMVISAWNVHQLKTKKCVYIWCNADQFVKINGLSGLYSGMFISEVGEAYHCGLPGTKQKTIDESNSIFSNILKENMDISDFKTTYSSLLDKYGMLAKTNKVAEYNFNRLYLV